MGSRMRYHLLIHYNLQRWMAEEMGLGSRGMWPTIMWFLEEWAHAIVMKVRPLGIMLWMYCGSVCMYVYVYVHVHVYAYVYVYVYSL